MLLFGEGTHREHRGYLLKHDLSGCFRGVQSPYIRLFYKIEDVLGFEPDQMFLSLPRFWAGDTDTTQDAAY